MTGPSHRLHDLLPVFHRLRDDELGHPLRALLDVIGEEVARLEEDIDQQYANWFIETCADWVVPYIGDLVGYRPVAEAGRAGDGPGAGNVLLGRVLAPRAEVANILAYRRRKGTLALLELLANNAGWPARAVEHHALLGWTQHLAHLRLDRGRLADLREGGALDRIGGAFDPVAHTVDLRRPGSNRTSGRYGLDSVAAFVWRLKPYSVSHSPANCIESAGSHCFSFSVLGNDTPLHTRPVPETDPTHIAEEPNLPVAIRRRALARHRPVRRSGHRPDPDLIGASESLYGAGKSLAIYAPCWPTRDSPQPVPAGAILAADLSDWRHRAKKGQILVDPERGRMVFPDRQLPKRGVWVDYHYAFSGDIGGGEYRRQLLQPAQCRIYRVARELTGDDIYRSINAALGQWRQDEAELAEAGVGAVVEILDSAAYSEQLRIDLAAGSYLQIRAADCARPVVRLLDYMAEQSDAFTISGKAGSRLVIDGLMFVGRGIQVVGPDREDFAAVGEGDLCDLTLRHTTLVPGWSLDCGCEPRRPNEPSVEMVDTGAKLAISRSIVGSIHVVADQVGTDPVSIRISDSIVDATSPQRLAVGATNLPVAFARASFERCTVFGRVEVHSIDLAENSIFLGRVRVARRQLGCLRFCYVLPGSRTPRRYGCQPDGAVAAAAPGDSEREALRVKPRFASMRYGVPTYGQLSLHCAPEILRGADDGSEPGAFHDLFGPQRSERLRARLLEYSPAEMGAEIIFAS